MTQPHPLPRRIMGALALSPMTVAELARCLSASPSATRKHVQRLWDAKWIVPTGTTGPRHTARVWMVKSHVRGRE